MAYCGMSSVDDKCEIYCYKSASQGYYVIHIQDRKSRILEKLPQRPATDHELDWYFWEKEAEKVIEDSELDKLLLPYNGKTIYLDHPLSTACFLKKLKKWGYHLPDYAIDRLMDEAKTENHMKIVGQPKEDGYTAYKKKTEQHSSGLFSGITFVSPNRDSRKVYELLGKDSFIEP